MIKQVTEGTKLKVHSFINRDKLQEKVGKQLKYSDIESLLKTKYVGVSIEDGGVVVTYSYRTFVTTYVSMRVYFEMLVRECVKDFESTLGVSVRGLKFEMESMRETTNGIYDNNDCKILLRMSLIRGSYTNIVNKALRLRIKKTIYHELSHYLHYRYLGEMAIPPEVIVVRRVHTKNKYEYFAYSMESIFITKLEGGTLSPLQTKLYHFVMNELARRVRI